MKYLARLAPWRLLAVALLLTTGCGLESVDHWAEHDASPSSRPATAAQPAARQQGETVSVASFNVQVFGVSKLGKPDVMEILVDAVRRFDVVAIQELRAKDQSIVPQFVEMINATGVQYDYVVGPRLGRTSSKEQYVYVYDTATIELDESSVYTVADPNDQLHRPPLVASFRVRGPPTEQAFTFTLVNIHTDPDETDTELDALADVFVSVQNNGSGEDDVILLGDLNVDEYGLGRLGRLPNVAYAISGVTTNTRGNKLYDNIIFDAGNTTEFTGQWGVLDLMAEYDLSLEEALQVSDHLPVWATFSIVEGRATRPVARRDEAPRRSSSQR